MSRHDEDMLRLQKAYEVILKLEEKLKETKTAAGEPIAVVGIGCRFPGNVNSAGDFYDLLRKGTDATGYIPKERWNYEEYEEGRRKKIYCEKGAFLSGVYDFDPLFFNISPAEAEYMDPQQRIFLEVAYSALEDAGFTIESLKNKSCGVYAGVVSNDYFGYLDGIEHSVEAYEVIGNYSSMLSSRISYFLNLRGPAITVDTACSSSASAIHLACQALRGGDCEMALAGGVTLYLTPRPYMLMCEANMLSRSGTTYAFDHRADGFVPGEGCGVVVLKTLSRAVEDNDRIYGIIRDSGTNQDGKSNGITAPSVTAQAELEKSILLRSQLQPEDISYVETHGTGTQLGDPIEINAMQETFRSLSGDGVHNKCIIGSLKPNVGHLQAAAGVASLIKVLLSLKHKKLFPTIHYERSNEHIDLEHTVFRIQHRFEDWIVPEGKKRIAMINSFGFSGTNVNLILEEYEGEEEKCVNCPPVMILPVSAAGKKSLKAYVNEISAFADGYSDEDSVESIKKGVRDILARESRMKFSDISLEDSLDMYINDPTKAMNIVFAIKKEFGLQMDLSYFSMFDDGTELCRYISSHCGSGSRDLLFRLAATFQFHRTQMKERVCFVFETRNQLKELLQNYLNGEKCEPEYEKLTDIQKECVHEWMEGKTVDWRLMYKGEKPKTTEAPTYPFDRKKYVVSPIRKKEKNKPEERVDKFAIPVIEDGKNNHTIDGREIMPAAYMIYRMWKALADSGRGRSFVMKNVEILLPMEVKDNPDAEIHMKQRNGNAEICLRASGTDRVFATATGCFGEEYAAAETEGRIDVSEGVTGRIEGAEWYLEMQTLGYSYGSEYQRIREITVRDMEAYAQLRNRRQSDAGTDYFAMDAAMQPTMAILKQDFPHLKTALPREVGCFQMFDPDRIPDRCIVKYKGKAENQIAGFDVAVYDEGWNAIALMKDLQIYVIEKEEQQKQENPAGTIRQEVIRFIKNEIQSAAKVDSAVIEDDKSFQVYGMDSFLSLKMIASMEKKLGKLPKTILFDCYNTDLLADFLTEKYGDFFRPDESHNRKSPQRPEAEGNIAVIPEEKLALYPEEKKVVDRLRAKYEKEGLAYARKEIAPYIFLGKDRTGMFYMARRENAVLAFLYLGEEKYLDSLVCEFEKYFSGNRIYFLLPCRLNRIGEKKAKWLSIGAFQRLNGFLDDISGKSYKHLRYAIKHFEKQGVCRTEEYRIHSDNETDRRIVRIVDDWIAQKKFVNAYIYQVREQIINKVFPEDYRFFLTTLNGELVSVIIITPMPGSNGYLMDLEFYGKDMPLGGLEYAICNICKALKGEQVKEFSFGVTFGVNADPENSTDELWADEFHTLNEREVFDGRGNFQFKNKFRTENTPLYISRPCDDTESGFLDIIMFIADPTGLEDRKNGKTDAAEEEKKKAYPVPLSLEKYHMNTVFLPAQEVKYDLLTDSWAELYKQQLGFWGQGYIADCSEQDTLLALQTFFPFTYIVPAASGRYAENLLFSVLKKNTGNVIHNGLFPTTRGNLISQGLCVNNISSDSAGDFSSYGLIDEEKIRDSLEKGIDYAVIELCDNAAGGLHIPYDKLQDVVSLLHSHDVKVFFDVTRAINHCLMDLNGITEADQVIAQQQKVLSLADGIFGSLTKEYQVPQGGIIGVNDTALYERIRDRITLCGSGLDLVQRSLIGRQAGNPEQIIADIVKRNVQMEKIAVSLGRLFPVLYRKGSHCALIHTAGIKELDGYRYGAQVFANRFYESTGIRIGVHCGIECEKNPEADFVRVILPVKTSDEDIDFIMEQLGKPDNIRDSFTALKLLKTGPEEFGMVKNKYCPVTETKNDEEKNIEESVEENIEEKNDEDRIAIIGISGRFPESENIYEFWDHLRDGRDSVTEVPAERKELLNSELPYQWGGFLGDIDKFDARFFQIPPVEAEKMDPQQRIFLQEAWHAIEDAGYRLSELRKNTDRNIGVFVGATWNEYSVYADAKEEFYPEINIGSIATKVAYYLDFCGPVMTVDTHCSSSLSAIYLACESLKRKNCEMAVAGGVNLSVSANKYYYAKHFLSKTGKCRSFGSMADGYVPGEAAGALLLKPLAKARRDGDHIYGVIRSVVQGHGGRTAGVTVPNYASQARVISEAIKRAGIAPESISYVETHGTGTSLGDPIEIAGLTQAFHIDQKGVCAIGSVKSNIGHSEAASGVVQIIKVLLQMKYRTLVPSLHAESLNEEIDFIHTPFVLQKKTVLWHTENIRRAGISSFGAGGVNCHLIMEEYPETKNEATEQAGYCVIPVSAKSKESLISYVRQFETFLLREDMEASVYNIAYTMQHGREIWKERIAFIVNGKDQLIRLCRKFIEGKDDPNIITAKRNFTGKAFTQVGLQVLAAEAVKYVETGADLSCAEAAVKGCRISLPGYSFEKESYWRKRKIPDERYLYTPFEICAVDKRREKKYDRLIIFEGMCTGHMITDSDSVNVIRIRKGTAFGEIGKSIYEIDPKDKKSYESLFNAIMAGAGSLLFVYDWLFEQSLSEFGEMHHEFAIPFFAALNRVALEHPVSVLAIGAYRDSQQRIPVKAAGIFLKTIHLENENFGIRYISCRQTEDFEKIWQFEKEREISGFSTAEYIDNKAYTEEYRGIHDEELHEESNSLIRPEGVYIITGGASGVGLLIAGALRKIGNVKLLLVGRRGLNDTIRDAISELSAEGAETEYMQADISVRQDAEHCIRYARERFGQINGLIHSAGVLKDSYFLKKTDEEFRTVCNPKIAGIRNLDEASKNEKLDFLAVFSSMAAVMGNIGQCDYAYANSYMDHFMEYRAQLCEEGLRYGKSIAINWPLWKNGGMQIPESRQELLYEQTGLKTMDTQTGISAFFKALGAEKTRVLVAYGDRERMERTFLKKTPEGKAPEEKRKSLIISPGRKDEITSVLCGALSKVTGLPVDKIDSCDSMEEYGLDSIMIETLTGMLEEHFGKLSPAVLFECNSIDQLAEFLLKKGLQEGLPSNRNSDTDGGEESEDIAVVGINGRFPGADDLQQFWDHLKQGKDSVSTVPPERWDHIKERDAIYCEWGGFLKNVDLFDNMLFNIAPKEAETIDPQERLFLESVWEMLEEAGYNGKMLERKYPKDHGAGVGVFVGETTNSYQLLMDESTKKNTVYPISSPWSIANRVSFVFNFTGPSIAIDTACSSSLVAVHMACESIKRKECSIAVAGGVNLYLHKSKYAAMCQLGMLSKTGKCHAFGKDADGFVPGEGVGCILLKPLSHALRDGDRIYGVIKGTAVNHGGHTNGYKVPSAFSQSMVVKEALKKADLNIWDMDYIEAHGTGTVLGDPIEFEGLMQLYEGKDYEPESCPLGSVKTNIGHTEAAAGIAGILKVLLQMEHRTLVPSLHAKETNAYINFAASPFYIPQKCSEWNARNGEVLRAGVSAFGAGGVNSHVIIEEYKK